MSGRSPVVDEIGRPPWVVCHAGTMDRTGRRGVLLTLAGVVVLAALVIAVPPLRDAVTNVVSGDASELRQELRDLGAAGALVLVGLMLVHAVVRSRPS